MCITQIFFHPDIFVLYRIVKDNKGTRKYYASPFDVPASMNCGWHNKSNKLSIEFLYKSDYDFPSISLGNSKVFYGCNTYRIYKIELFPTTKDIFLDEIDEVIQKWEQFCEDNDKIESTAWNRYVISTLLNVFSGDIANVAFPQHICSVKEIDYLTREIALRNHNNSGSISFDYIQTLRSDSVWYRIPILGNWLVGRQIKKLTT